MSTLKADTIQSTGGGSATLTKQECCISWWQYDQTNDETDGSFNVSGIVDDATGLYTVTLATAQTNITDRSVQLTSNHEDGDSNCRMSALSYDKSGTYSASAITVRVFYNDNWNLSDNNHNFGNVYGALSCVH